MSENQSATDDFLDGLDKNEELNLTNQEEPLFPEETEKKEEKVPYHENEKIQRYIAKEVNKRMKDIKPSAEDTFKEEIGEPKFVSSLEKIIGNDTPEKIKALTDLKEDWKGMTKQAKQEALREIIEAQRESAEKDEEEFDEAVNELEEGREDIESSLGKPLTERQWDAYRDYLLDNEPEGGYESYPNFVRSFNRFKSSYTRSNATAKNLASRGMDRSATSSPEAPKAQSWEEWDAVKENLFKK